ncbi:hypothetical protein GCM10028813_27260 [Ramlibacter alkalitolerans]
MPAVCAKLQVILNASDFMRSPHVPDSQARLLPAGRRWGFGAHSVLPYLSFALQSRPGQAPGESIRNPVFPQMENTLPVLLRRSH